MVVVEVNGYTIKPDAGLKGADLRGVKFRSGLFGGGEISLEGANLEGADLSPALPPRLRFRVSGKGQLPLANCWWV